MRAAYRARSRASGSVGRAAADGRHRPDRTFGRVSVQRRRGRRGQESGRALHPVRAAPPLSGTMRGRCCILPSVSGNRAEFDYRTSRRSATMLTGETPYTSFGGCDAEGAVARGRIRERVERDAEAGRDARMVPGDASDRALHCPSSATARAQHGPVRQQGNGAEVLRRRKRSDAEAEPRSARCRRRGLHRASPRRAHRRNDRRAREAVGCRHDLHGDARHVRTRQHGDGLGDHPRAASSAHAGRADPLTGNRRAASRNGQHENGRARAGRGRGRTTRFTA